MRVGMSNFESIRFDDAEISTIAMVGSDIHVSYKDWREDDHLLVFKRVVGYQWFSPEGRALSHGTVEVDDDFLRLACDMAEEGTTDGLKVFSFVAAWDDLIVLRIVAADVEKIPHG